MSAEEGRKPAFEAPPGAASVPTRDPYTPPTSKGRELDPVEARKIRADRYVYQSVARLLIGSAGHREGMTHPFNFHRTAKCRHTTLGTQVSVHQSIEHRGAFYGGLAICGSVWACSVCSAKIQERRRVEISEGVAWAYKSGYKCVMITLTFPHLVSDDLGDLLDKQAASLKLLRTGSPWKRFKERRDYQGLIRSLEVTHGEHGWHPHVHELWIVDKDTDGATMLEDIKSMWESACIRSGLLPPEKVAAFRLHAVDLHDNASTGDYLAKQDSSRVWGVDHELAKGSKKASKKSGAHPFQLLVRAEQGDKRAAAQYLEYIVTMRDKRKRQLYWTPGLKGRVGLDEKEDEEIAKESQDKADVLGLLSYDQWRAIRTNDKRAQVLDAAETGGWAAVVELIKALGQQPQKPLQVLPPGEPRKLRRRTRELEQLDLLT